MTFPRTTRYPHGVHHDNHCTKCDCTIAPPAGATTNFCPCCSGTHPGHLGYEPMTPKGDEGGVTREMAIEAACTALQEVGSKLIYRDGATYSRHQCNQMAELLRTPSAQDGPVTERSCTCHPDDNPPVPCPRKYALSECRAASTAEVEALEFALYVIDADASDWSDHGGTTQTHREYAQTLRNLAARLKGK